MELGRLLDAPQTIAADLVGLCRVLGLKEGIRWLWCVARKARTIARSGNMLSADEAMGVGPHRIYLRGNRQFWVAGRGAISGVREMYVRDVYLSRGQLCIEDGDRVVDLGANMGNFTNMALASGPAVKVVAVEPNRTLNDAFRSSLGLNPGFLERARLIPAFIGLRGQVQEEMEENRAVDGATWITEEDLLRLSGFEKIDFLKCDIEGGEFGLLSGDRLLLRRSTKLAIEIHAFAGDVRYFLSQIEVEGYTILSIAWAGDGSCTALAKR